MKNLLFLLLLFIIQKIRSFELKGEIDLDIIEFMKNHFFSEIKENLSEMIVFPAAELPMNFKISQINIKLLDLEPKKL